MTSRTSVAKAGAGSLLLFLTAQASADPAGQVQQPADDATLTLLSVDVRTLPGAAPQSSDPGPPAWRTSFGSERRSESTATRPKSAVDADIVLLQGVTDVAVLRRWFPARHWKLVVSRQFFDRGSDIADLPSLAARSKIPTTAVAVRLRRGLRLTGRDHLLELATPSSPGSDGPPAAAGTAVRVQIEGRETWALSVLLPEDCRDDCRGRAALQKWYQERDSENVRRVTAGRFLQAKAPAEDACAGFGLELHPTPPAPRPSYIQAANTPDLGCAASVTVAK